MHAFLTLFCFLSAIAQRAHGNDSNGPEYDLHTETKMKGTVAEVRLMPTGSGKGIAHLMVNIEPDILDVYLRPKTFLEEMGVSFSKGDEVAVKGSKIKQNKEDLFLAREVVKGNGFPTSPNSLSVLLVLGFPIPHGVALIVSEH